MKTSEEKYSEIAKILYAILIFVIVIALTNIVSCSATFGSIVYSAFPPSEVKKMLTDSYKEEPRVPSAKIINR